MGSTILWSPAWMSGRTIAATDEASTYPASNLGRPHPTDRWRTQDVAGIKTVTITGATEEPANSLGLFFSNASTTGTWRSRLITLAGDAGLDSAPWGCAFHWDDPQAEGLISSATLNFAGNFTIEVRVEALFNRKQAIWEWELDASNALVLGHDISGKVRLWDRETPGNINLLSTSDLVAGTPMHIAVTYDGADVSLVINGTTEASVTATPPGATRGATLRIPAQWPGGGVEEIFAGTIDDLRIWDVYRDDAAIDLDDDAPLESPYSGDLVAYWPLEDGTGTTSADVASGGSISWAFNAAAAEGYWRYANLIRSRPELLGWDSYHAASFVDVSTSAAVAQIDILDPRNTDGYVQASRAYGSNSVKTTRGRRFNSEIGFRDMSQRTNLPSGSMALQRRRARPTNRFTLVFTDESEALESVMGIARDRRGRDVAVLHDYDSDPTHVQEKFGYGVLQQRHGLKDIAKGVWEYDFQLEGLI